MSPLQQLEQLRAHLDFCRGHLVPADRVLEVIDFVIVQLHRAEAEPGLSDEWVSLKAAMRRSGRSESWFRARLQCYRNHSRLELWADSGQARQEGRQWFILVQVLPPPEAPESASNRRPALQDAVAASHPPPADDAFNALYSQLNQFIQAA